MPGRRNRFDGKFVVRAGYGITQYMEGTGSNLRLPLNPPFFAEADVPYMTDQWRRHDLQGFTDVIVRGTPAGCRMWNPNLRPQFTQQWNLTLEYQIVQEYFGVGGLCRPLGDASGCADRHQPTVARRRPCGDALGTVLWAADQTRRPLFSLYPHVTQTSVTDSWAISNYTRCK